MGWEDCHLHDFVIKGRRYATRRNSISTASTGSWKRSSRRAGVFAAVANQNSQSSTASAGIFPATPSRP
ncbi:MAG TPA: hypothetical protein VEU30_01975 [Thermoanaerobaculia bacterium]|nr:hypothetical protein [Thermoanaerobaculia bacterium]